MNRPKEIRLTVRFCDESELTTEERARMEAARKYVDHRVSELIPELLKRRTLEAAPETI